MAARQHVNFNQTRREGKKTYCHARSVLVYPKRTRACNQVDIITAAFAKSLEESLRSGAGPHSSLTADLDRQVDSVTLISKEVAAIRNHELDGQGTRLWNLASRYKSDRSGNPELLCLRMLRRSVLFSPLLTGTVRVFPCLLLDCAQRVTENLIPSKSICTVQCSSVRINHPRR